MGSWRIRIFWGNPYTEPPHGQPRTLKAVLCEHTKPPYPPEIAELLALPEYKPGSGWTVGYECIEQRQVRRWSQAAKARVRQGNLRKRIEKKFPLFAKDFIAAEIASRPSYYEAAE